MGNTPSLLPPTSFHRTPSTNLRWWRSDERNLWQSNTRRWTYSYTSDSICTAGFIIPHYAWSWSGTTAVKCIQWVWTSWQWRWSGAGMPKTCRSNKCIFERVWRYGSGTNNLNCLQAANIKYKCDICQRNDYLKILLSEFRVALMSNLRDGENEKVEMSAMV